MCFVAQSVPYYCWLLCNRYVDCDNPSRYLDSYDGSYDYNSTACKELRQEIMDVKVLTMWVYRLCWECSDGQIWSSRACVSCWFVFFLKWVSNLDLRWNNKACALSSNIQAHPLFFFFFFFCCCCCKEWFDDSCRHGDVQSAAALPLEQTPAQAYMFLRLFHTVLHVLEAVPHCPMCS